MTRMTSDIENLQQLLQDGLAQFAIQGLTMVVDHGRSCSPSTSRWRSSPSWSSCRCSLVMSLWFRRASERGYLRVRDGIANVLADLSESLHGVRVVTAHNRQRHNVVHHRNVVGEYRDANNYTGRRSTPSTGPAPSCSAILGQARPARRSAATWCCTTRSRVGALVAFFLYLNRFFQPIQLLVQQYNTLQQGQASIIQAAHAARDRAHRRRGARRRRAPPIDGEIVFDDVTFGYDPDAPGARRRRPAHRARRDRRLRRADRGRQVDDGQARHPLLRPDRRAGARSTGTTSAT